MRYQIFAAIICSRTITLLLERRKYLGLGPSAHSSTTVAAMERANNIQYLKSIIEGNPTFEKEMLSEKDRYNEYVMTPCVPCGGRCRIYKIQFDEIFTGTL